MNSNDTYADHCQECTVRRRPQPDKLASEMAKPSFGLLAMKVVPVPPESLVGHAEGQAALEAEGHHRS